MEKEERIWLGVLILVFLAFNIVTLSPLVPWQQWLLWSNPTPAQRVAVEFGDYEIKLPPNGDILSSSQGIVVQAGEFVEFVATSRDVTYGLGVFRPDGTMVFQMQVIPGYENKLVWKFDAPGTYDVRSTEYSGPRHSEMFVKNAIQVMP
jgi:cytochrome c oxidase subunit 2